MLASSDNSAAAAAVAFVVAFARGQNTNELLVSNFVVAPFSVGRNSSSLQDFPFQEGVDEQATLDR